MDITSSSFRSFENPMAPLNSESEAGRFVDRMPLLIEIWRILLRWKWVIAGIIALTVLAGLIATLMMTPLYTATTRVEISRNQEKITNVEGIMPADIGRDVEFYQTQYSLLKARSLAERVARSLKLAEDPAYLDAFAIKGDGSFFSSSAGQRLTPAQQQSRFRTVVSNLIENTKVDPVRGSSLVDISVQTPNPVLSAKIANEWAKQFAQAALDRRFSSTADARQFLEGRLAQLRERLEKSETDLVQYASNQQIIPLATAESADGKTRTERTLVGDNLEALNAALAQATADRVTAESRASTSGNTTSSVLNSSSISVLRQRRAEIASEYSKVLAQFEPEYPAAQALFSQLATLDRSIEREETRAQSGVGTEYREAVKRETDLRQRVDTLKHSLLDQRRRGIQYNIYQREVDTNRQLYDGLLQRYKEIGVAGVGSNNIAVIDPATPPNSPSSPKLLSNVFLSLLLGLGLAALATFALVQIDEGIGSPADVSQSIGLPVLGSIPDVEQADIFAELDDQRSPASEAYLSVLTNLSFSTDHGVPRSIMITSTRPSEGKSSTSLAIAKLLARTGRQVILIDADMRSPSAHKYMGTENSNGLSNYLAGNDDWQPLVNATSYPGLALITAGPHPPSAAELLSGPRMGNLIRDLREKFDHIVIDSPPVLGLADAPLLAAVAEGVVYIVEANGVRLRGIRAALSRLVSAHAHILGVLLTKHNLRHSFYGYGYDYGYGYGRADKK